MVGPRAALATLALALVLSGSLGAPFQRDEVPFEAVERAHFDAFGVTHARASPSSAPLEVRVRLLGDATDVDLAVPQAWLLQHANVVLVPDAQGVPLFLTRGDLSATSGRATLGATVSIGMAVEATNPQVRGCVVAHEVLHFLGLRHLREDDNIMHPQCTRDRLDHAGLTVEQRAHLDGIRLIQAATPRGMQTWAARAG